MALVGFSAWPVEEAGGGGYLRAWHEQPCQFSSAAAAHSLLPTVTAGPLTIAAVPPASPSHPTPSHPTQVAFPEGVEYMLAGQRHALLQFHFHTPSEHTLDGKHLAMEAHLVHRNLDTGNLAVLGVFIEVSGCGWVAGWAVVEAHLRHGNLDTGNLAVLEGGAGARNRGAIEQRATSLVMPGTCGGELCRCVELWHVSHPLIQQVHFTELPQPAPPNPSAPVCAGGQQLGPQPCHCRGAALRAAHPRRGDPAAAPHQPQ